MRILHGVKHRQSSITGALYTRKTGHKRKQGAIFARGEILDTIKMGLHKFQPLVKHQYIGQETRNVTHTKPVLEVGLKLLEEIPPPYH